MDSGSPQHHTCPDLRGLLEEKEAASRARLLGLLLEEWAGSRALADTQCRTHRPPTLPLLLSARSSPAPEHG